MCQGFPSSVVRIDKILQQEQNFAIRGVITLSTGAGFVDNYKKKKTLKYISTSVYST